MLLIAVIYSFVFYLIVAPNQEALKLFLYDSIVVFFILCPIGIILSSIVKYGAGAIRSKKYQTVFFVMVITFCLVASLGIETLVIFLISNALNSTIFALFAPSLAARALIFLCGYTTLLFAVNKQNLSQHQLSEPNHTSKNTDVTTVAQTSSQIEDHISIRDGQKIKIISIEEIEYLQADGDYVKIHTEDGQWMKEQTMKYFEEHLPQNMFVRIHRSYIVNIKFLSRIERYGQLQNVILRDGSAIKISAAGYKLLKSIIS